MPVPGSDCPWRAIPKGLPPRHTVHDYLILSSYGGTRDRIHHALYVVCREQENREARAALGLLLHAIIDPTQIQDGAAGILLLATLGTFGGSIKHAVREGRQVARRVFHHGAGKI